MSRSKCFFGTSKLSFVVFIFLALKQNMFGEEHQTKVAPKNGKRKKNISGFSELCQGHLKMNGGKKNGEKSEQEWWHIIQWAAFSQA